MYTQKNFLSLCFVLMFVNLILVSFNAFWDMNLNANLYPVAAIGGFCAVACSFLQVWKNEILRNANASAGIAMIILSCLNVGL